MTDDYGSNLRWAQFNVDKPVNNMITADTELSQGSLRMKVRWSRSGIGEFQGGIERAFDHINF